MRNTSQADITIKPPPPVDRRTLSATGKDIETGVSGRRKFAGHGYGKMYPLRKLLAGLS